MHWEKKLTQWAANMRACADVPARLALWNGQSFDFGAFDQPAVTLHVRSASAVPLLLDANLNNLGEAYINKQIDVEGKLTDIIEVAYALAKITVDRPHNLQRMTRYFNHSKASDRKSIQYHYDVSDDFYAQWLDAGMVYSCAYFENGDEDLATAQMKKIDHILTKIQLQRGQSLLDIGCGWGALVMRAAQKFGARCVGITLSEKQFEWASRSVKEAGLADSIQIRRQDYRDISGQFDRITSVGMFEHVGKANLPHYFTRMRTLLANDGVIMNHGIASTDPNSGEMGNGGGEFIDKYVFPNGELPHLSLVLKSMQEGGLEAFDVENLRRRYARTLRLWSNNYEANSEKLRQIVDEEKFRIWRIYLAGCAHAFENDELAIFQIVGRKAGSRANTLPWSRRYIYPPHLAEGEAAVSHSLVGGVTRWRETE